MNERERTDVGESSGVFCLLHMLLCLCWRVLVARCGSKIILLWFVGAILFVAQHHTKIKLKLKFEIKQTSTILNKPIHRCRNICIFNFSPSIRCSIFGHAICMRFQTHTIVITGNNKKLFMCDFDIDNRIWMVC